MTANDPWALKIVNIFVESKRKNDFSGHCFILSVNKAVHWVFNLNTLKSLIVNLNEPYITSLTQDNLSQEAYLISYCQHYQHDYIFYLFSYLYRRKLLEMLTDNASAAYYIGLLTLRSRGAGLSFKELGLGLNREEDTLTVWEGDS